MRDEVLILIVHSNARKMTDNNYFTQVSEDPVYKIPVCSYDKLVYNFTCIGECHVLGVAIIEEDRDGADDGKHVLDLQLAKKALDYLVWRHPLLRAHLERQGKKSDESDNFDSDLRLVISNKRQDLDADNSKHLEWRSVSSRNDLPDLLTEFNSAPYNVVDSNNPTTRPWRLCWIGFKEDALTKHAVAFSIPLYFCDGLCISALLVEYMNIVNSILLDQTCQEMSTRLDLADDVHSLVKKNRLMDENKLRKLEQLRSRHLPSSRLHAKLRENGDERGCQINMFSLDESATKKCVQFCKSRDLKLTGYLSAILLYALEDLYAENGLQFPHSFFFGLAANLRIRVEPKIEMHHLRSLTTLVFTDKICHLDKDIAKCAAHLNELIQDAVDVESGKFFIDSYNQEEIDETNRLFETTGSQGQILEAMAQDLDFDLIFSNTGKFVFDQKVPNPSTPWTVKEIYFCDSPSSYPLAEPALILHCSYWQDKLMFMLSANRAGINSVYIDQYVELIEKRFLKELDIV